MFSFLKKPVRTKPVSKKATPQRVHEVAGRSIPLKVIENQRATRITLRIEPGGKALKMTIPYGIHHGMVDQFLERHNAWLVEKLGKVTVTSGLTNGDYITLRGARCKIEYTGSLRGVTKTKLADDGSLIILVSGIPELISKKVMAYLKKEAKADLEDRVRHHAAFVSKPVKSITLKDTKSRWGSCSYAGNLSFSWRIIMAPDSVIDYLAAHEVAHLQEMNHGPDFWALCKKLCPHTEEAKAWLKNNGSQLHAIDFT